MNKKLIKTIASITCGLGVVATVPAVATSCGENKIKAVNADELHMFKVEHDKQHTNMLDILGWSTVYAGSEQSIAWQSLKNNGVNAIYIPVKYHIDNGQGQYKTSYPIVAIAAYAFSTLGLETRIPSFINQIIFEDECESGSQGEIDHNQIESIGMCAFANASSLTSLSLPCNLEEIGFGAFDGCTGITKLDLSACGQLKASGFGELCFDDLYIHSEKDVILPENADFGWATNLSKKHVISGNYYGTVLVPADENGDFIFSSKSVALGAIGFGEIDFTNWAKNMKFPYTAADFTEIAASAFEGTDITSITLPDNLLKIGFEAFRDCTWLNEITYVGLDASTAAPTFEYTTGCFDNISKVGKIYSKENTNFTSTNLRDAIKSFLPEAGAGWIAK